MNEAKVWRKEKNYEREKSLDIASALHRFGDDDLGWFSTKVLNLVLKTRSM